MKSTIRGGKKTGKSSTVRSSAKKPYKVPHERTPLGRLLLKLKKQVEAWIALNRDHLSEKEIWDAEWLACDLYVAAANGLAIGKRNLIEAEKIAARMASKR